MSAGAGQARSAGLAAGARARALFSRLLGVSSGDGPFDVRAVHLSGGRFQVRIAPRDGEEVELVLEPLPEGERAAPFGSAHLRLWYRGQQLAPHVSARLAQATRRWRALTFDRLLDALHADLAPAPRASAMTRDAEGGPDQALFDDLQRAYPFLTVERGVSDAEARPLHQVHLRVAAQCNQRCPFCQAPPPSRHALPSTGELLECVDRLTSLLPRTKWTLTGGEPTVREDLVELCEGLLGRPGVELVSVQTNAVNLGRTPGRRTFPRDPRLSFLVGFHHTREPIYDRCTGTQGQLRHAVAGIASLCETGHDVELNCVVHEANVGHLPDMLRDVAALFATQGPPSVHFSVMAAPDHRDGTALAVRYTDFVTEVEAALELGDRLGLATSVAVSAYHTAIPACLLGPRIKARSEYPDVYEHAGNAADPTAAWVKGGACAGCVEDARCLGLPRPYADRFGTGELVAVEEAT